MFEGTTHESRPRAGSRLVQPSLHTEAGTVSAIHPRLYAGARSAARRSRFAAPLSRHTAIRAPDAHHSRARGVYPAPARHRTQHTIADRSRRTAAVTPQPTSISQNRCARVLAAREADLRELNEGLENEVQERTGQLRVAEADLRELNAGLENEVQERTQALLVPENGGGWAAHRRTGARFQQHAHWDHRQLGTPAASHRPGQD